MVLLEHDNRFAVFGDEFVFYDFVEPFKLPGEFRSLRHCLPSDEAEREQRIYSRCSLLQGQLGEGLTCTYAGNLKGAVTRIICDPPFLSEDCQTKGKLYLHGRPCEPTCSHKLRPLLTSDISRVETAAMTVRWLAKPSPAPSSSSSSSAPNRLIVCTGERMEELVTRLYKPFGVRTTTYEPVHAQGLSNEFYCYASFECGEWRWKA